MQESPASVGGSRSICRAISGETAKTARSGISRQCSFEIGSEAITTIAVPRVVADVRKTADLAIMNPGTLDVMQRAAPAGADQPLAIGQKDTQPDRGGGIDLTAPSSDLPEDLVKYFAQWPSRSRIMS